MLRRRRSGVHANHDRWLVSYADFITLLFAFFVVLYASAQVDQRKIGKLAMAIQTAFQELGIFSVSPAQVPVNLHEPLSFKNGQPGPNAHRDQARQLVYAPPDPVTTAWREANLAALQAELQQALQREIAMRTVSLHRESEGLVISLREFGFFDSGSATLRSSAYPALDRIAAILALRTCHLRIEGHTDDVPIHTPKMASNWELSTARATELVRLLIERYRFAPERLSAAGYAQFHPIASNDTVEGRAQNRRVDLVILTQYVVRSDMHDQATAAKPSAGVP